MYQKATRLLFSQQNLPQTILKNTLWLTISQVVSRLIRAIIVIYSARVLGAEGYGVFSYGLAVAGLLSVFFSDIGINRILIKEASRQPESRAQYIATTFGIKLTLLSFLWAMLVWAAPYFSKIAEVDPLLPIIGCLFFLDGLRDFGYAIIRSVERMEIEAGINIFTNIATVLISWFMLTYLPTPHALAIAYTVASLLGTTLTIVTLRRFWAEAISQFRYRLIRPLLSDAWPFAISNWLWAIIMYTDVIMLGWLTHISEVGLYSAAQRPIQLLAALPVIVAGSTLPAFAKLAQHEQTKFKTVLEQSIAIAMLFALPLAGGGLTMSRSLISVLYGNSYSDTAVVLQVLATSLIITFPTLVIYHAIFANDLQRKFIWPMGFGAIANVLLNALLIPRWGALGAAIATVISQFAAYGWICVAVRRQFKLTMFPLIYRMIIATGLMVGTILIGQRLGISFYLVLIIAMATYLGSLLLLKEPLIGRLRLIWLKT
ncbi:MAG: flippase [Patescibacteria group bacterium]|jgi:O-antigen/teichoic acid export membrane protein